MIYPEANIIYITYFDNLNYVQYDISKRIEQNSDWLHLTFSLPEVCFTKNLTNLYFETAINDKIFTDS